MAGFLFSNKKRILQQLVTFIRKLTDVRYSDAFHQALAGF